MYSWEQRLPTRTGMIPKRAIAKRTWTSKSYFLGGSKCCFEDGVVIDCHLRLTCTWTLCVGNESLQYSVECNLCGMEFNQREQQTTREEKTNSSVAKLRCFSPRSGSR